MVAAVFILLAALLTVPWTFWVIYAAYERDVTEKVTMLAHRVELQLNAQQPWWPLRSNQPNTLLEPLKAELLSDDTVQAVVFLDYSKGLGGYVQRNDAIPIPRSLEDVDRMLHADSSSIRKSFPLTSKSDKRRGTVYVDLSKSALLKHFWDAEGPLLWRVGYQTAVALIVVALAGIYAYHLWGSAQKERLRAELEQQGLLAERGLTAAVLAHEIRNPLAALRFQLHSLRRNAQDATRVSSTADTIDGELSRIQQLVQDYLAHERAQAMRVTPVELLDAVHALQTLMGEMLRENGTRLIVHDGPPVVVACDPHALRQILMNLVLNAQQAMGRGGQITISIGQEEGFGIISVSDTGPGIPDEMRDRLFKPFATSKKEGSGIGLALVKRFVDNFGGSVSVESEPGRGATFRLRLPLAGGETAGMVLEYDGGGKPPLE
jgi:signal transduction histidine kinase